MKAVLYQSHYRNTLAACKGQADLVVTSPPYCDEIQELLAKSKNAQPVSTELSEVEPPSVFNLFGAS